MSVGLLSELDEDRAAADDTAMESDEWEIAPGALVLLLRPDLAENALLEATEDEGADDKTTEEESGEDEWNEEEWAEAETADDESAEEETGEESAEEETGEEETEEETGEEETADEEIAEGETADKESEEESEEERGEEETADDERAEEETGEEDIGDEEIGEEETAEEEVGEEEAAEEETKDESMDEIDNETGEDDTAEEEDDEEDVSYVPGRVTVLVIRVTAPWARARPSIVAPSSREIDVPAKMVPTNCVFCPSPAAVPTTQYTLDDIAPLTDRTCAPDAVVNEVPSVKINTAFVMFCASSVSVPVIWLASVRQ
jgi:hypothetical protein